MQQQLLSAFSFGLMAFLHVPMRALSVLGRKGIGTLHRSKFTTVETAAEAATDTV